MIETIHCELAVLGGGPGGYTAAFRAADLGKDVVLIEKEERIGGVCLNVGCIPSKTLLHAAEILTEAQNARSYGIHFPKPKIKIEVLRHKKEQVVSTLTEGLMSLAKARNVRVIRGTGKFLSNKEISITNNKKKSTILFENAIIAVGSAPVELPFLPKDDNRIWDSTEALAIPFIPKRLAVLGGGIIGLEMAEVYAALGSEITLIEMCEQIIPSADADLIRPLEKKLKKTYKNLYTSTKLTKVETRKDSLHITIESMKKETESETIEADALLVAVGRRPQGKNIGADALGNIVDERGFIPVNEQMQTKVHGIYAIGDVVGEPMLAHKAVHEGKVAAEVIAGMKSAFTPMCIPSVAYTDPEIAWVGYTEKRAKEENISFEKGVFPWVASGRALSADKTNGFSKVLFDSETKRLIGAGIVGARAGDIIAESALSIELGAVAEDISKTIHAHPTFAETLALATEMVEGTITDALPPRKKRGV